MTVKRWHIGKLIMLWSWGLVLVGIGLALLEFNPFWLIGVALIAVMLAIPITLSVLTWKWLSGREGEIQAPKKN